MVSSVLRNINGFQPIATAIINDSEEFILVITDFLENNETMIKIAEWLKRTHFMK